MAIISQAVLLGISDRCAYQYGLLITPVASMNVTGGGYYWQRITATEDPDVEIPLLSPYYSIDYNITLNNIVQNGCPQLAQIVTNMDTHFSRVGHTTSWDGYLRDRTIRISDYFNQVYKLAKGSYMLANNVFSEAVNSFCTWTYSGGFVDGMSYGDGSWSNRADGTKFAGTQLKVVSDTGSTSIGGMTLDITGKDDANVVKIMTGVGPITLASPGDEADIGSSSDRWLDVTALSVSGGASGNKIKIVNKKERQIAM